MVFSEHVKIREEKFGTVIFDTLKEKIFVTNKTGRDILRLIKENRALEDMIKILEDEYGEGQTKEDIVYFIGELRKNEILVE